MPDSRQCHRSRLRSLYKKKGLKEMSPRAILELVLFYAVPRRDTSPIAKSLLDHFVTIDRVFSANLEELKQVKGVGESTAILLKASADIFYQYAEPEYVGKISADYPFALESFAENILKGAKKDQLILSYADEQNYIARVETYDADDKNVPQKAAASAKKYGFNKVMIISNQQDTAPAKALTEALKANGLHLIQI